jgi:anti-anti-sigma factor
MRPDVAPGTVDGDHPPKADVRVSFDADVCTLRLLGEHDLSTAGLFTTALAEAVATADVDVVVDLTDVTFMDCSTIRSFVNGRSLCASGNRSLTVRCFSARQRWLLEICGLADLIDVDPIKAAPEPYATTPLESWVAVPATTRLSQVSEIPVERASLSDDPERSRK